MEADELGDRLRFAERSDVPGAIPAPPAIRFDFHSEVPNEGFKRSSTSAKGMAKTITPTRKGADLDSKDRQYDAHIRLEGRKITVDVFDSREEDPDEAHVESEAFSATKGGAMDAEDYLAGYGIDATVRPPKTRRR